MSSTRRMTEAQERALKKYRSKKLDSGYKPVTVWLSDATVKRLDQLAVTYGSRPKVIEALLGG